MTRLICSLLQPKYKKRTPAVEVADSEIDDDDDDFDENNVDDNKDSDPDWARTPLLKRDLKPRRKTDLFKQNIQVM